MMLVVLIAAAIAIGWIAWQFVAAQPETDEATLCPVDGPVAATIILLDLTDPLGPAQAGKLSAILDGIVEEAATGTMISLGVVSEDPENWGAKFALCKPASGEVANALYQNPALIAQSFAENFNTPLSGVIAAMMRSSPENQSPIMEAMQTLIAETPGVVSLTGPTRIVIASDMLQNSDTLSFYRGEGWEHLQQTGSVARLSRNLSGADITLIRIPRPNAGAAALSELEPFWAQYLDRQGAAAPFHIISLGDL